MTGRAQPVLCLVLVTAGLLGAMLPGAAASAQTTDPAPTQGPAAVQPAPPVPMMPASPAAQAPAAPAPAVDATVLPEALSPWSMVRDADVVVQGVMGGLAFASLVTWTIWLAKALELLAAKRKARSATRRLADSDSLDQAVRALGGSWTRSGPVADMTQAATLELRRSAALSADGIKERLAIQLVRIEARAGRSMTRGTGILATIGSTAPFVGLFGTVWGIMNAFIGISQTRTTSLAVVAPGIAEALLATAIGLVAAIPAVIIYNVFARAIAGYRAVLSDAAGEVLQHVSRDLDRGARAAAEPPLQRRPAQLAAAE